MSGTTRRMPALTWWSAYIQGPHQGTYQLYVSCRDKNQVVGLELKEAMILCGRAAQATNF